MDASTIRIDTDYSQATQNTQRYQQQAQNLFNKFREEAEKQYKDQRKINDAIKERIRLYQEEDRLNRRATEREDRADYRAGKMTREKYEESKSSRDEWREETKGVSSSLNEELKNLNENIRKGSGGASGARGVLGVAGDLSSGDVVGGTANVVEMASGALSAGVWGALGGAAVGLAIKALGSGAMNLEQGAERYSVLTGQDIKSKEFRYEVNTLDTSKLAEMGLTPSEYYSKMFGARMKFGGKLNEDFSNLYSITQGTTLEESDISSLLGITRYGKGSTVSGTAKTFESYLQRTGQSIERLPEIIGTFTTTATDIISRKGSVDVAAVSSTITALGRMSGFTGVKQDDLVSNVSKNFRQSSNPVIQAMQWHTMSTLPSMQGKSLFGMEAAMENPLENPEYIMSMLKQTRKMSVGGEAHQRAIYALVYGGVEGKKQSAIDLSNKLLGKSDEEQDALLKAELNNVRGSASYLSEGGSKTSTLTETSKRIQSEIEKEGFVSSSWAAEKITTAFNDLKKFMDEQGAKGSIGEMKVGTLMVTTLDISNLGTTGAENYKEVVRLMQIDTSLTFDQAKAKMYKDLFSRKDNSSQ